MITHCYQPVQSLYFQGIQAFFTPHQSTEAKKMQTYDTTQSANPAQYYPNQGSNNAIVFIVLFSLALFLAYACFHGYIVEGFIYSLSYFFDNFQVKIHNNNIIADIALLVLLLLAVFGLYCVFKFFFVVAITALIIAAIVAGAVMYSQDNHTKPTLKDTLIHDGRAKSDENVGG